MRTVTLTDYLADTKQLLIQTLNDRARRRGEDVEIVAERPRPRLVANGGAVLQFQRGEEDGDGDE